MQQRRLVGRDHVHVGSLRAHLRVTMNAAYWLAVIWGLLAVAGLLFTKGPKNHVVIALCALGSVLASLLGIAISYNLL